MEMMLGVTLVTTGKIIRAEVTRKLIGCITLLLHNELALAMVYNLDVGIFYVR